MKGKGPSLLGAVELIQVLPQVPAVLQRPPVAAAGGERGRSRASHLEHGVCQGNAVLAATLLSHRNELFAELR